MAMTDYLENALLKHSTGLEAYTMPTSVKLVLLEDDPGEIGSLTSELSGGGYARVDITNVLVLSNNKLINNSDILFPTATADWNLINYFGIVDQDSNLLYYTAAASAISITENETLRIKANYLSISMD